jgi:hypothetical protein
VAQHGGRGKDAAHCTRGWGPVCLVDVVDITVAVCQSSRGRFPSSCNSSFSSLRDTLEGGREGTRCTIFTRYRETHATMPSCIIRTEFPGWQCGSTSVE